MVALDLYTNPNSIDDEQWLWLPLQRITPHVIIELFFVYQ